MVFEFIFKVLKPFIGFIERENKQLINVLDMFKIVWMPVGDIINKYVLKLSMKACINIILDIFHL